MFPTMTSTLKHSIPTKLKTSQLSPVTLFCSNEIFQDVALGFTLPLMDVKNNFKFNTKIGLRYSYKKY